MRIPEGILTPPILIFSWIASFITLYLIFNFALKLEFDNRELTRLGIIGAFVFFVSSIPLPLQFIIPIPLYLTLSGVTLAFTLLGWKKGVLVCSSALMLNHILIPGSLSVMGTDLMNMLISGSIAGTLSYEIFHNSHFGRRIRYLGTFLCGFGYIIIEGTLIAIELILFVKIREDIKFLGYLYFLTIAIIGILEGSFTALSCSYYYRTFLMEEEIEDDFEEEESKIQLGIDVNLADDIITDLPDDENEGFESLDDSLEEFK